MKILGFLKDKQKRTNLIIWFLIAAIGIVVIWGFKHGSNPLHIFRIDQKLHIADSR